MNGKQKLKAGCPAQNEARDGKRETGPFSILVVDDEEYILTFVAIKLKISGYRVLTADNGIDALEIIRNTPPDMVIIDIIMPGMNGIELLKEIRSFSSVPVIVLSAIESQEVVTREFREGADDFIHKPFNPDELVVRIEAIRKRLCHPPDAGKPGLN